MASTQYDEALLSILQSEGKILPFLDVLFGFLYRCTDFYHEHERPAPVGFPPGVAEQMTLTAFRKWQQLQRRRVAGETEHAVPVSPAAAPNTAAAQPRSRDAPSQTSAVCTTDSGSRRADQHTPAAGASGAASDAHNGAARDGYCWSQTIGDLTVRVPVPADVRRGRQVHVHLQPERVGVRLAGAAAPLLDGALHRAIRPAESCWSLLPGDCVQLSLEKARESWWSSLLQSEPAIDLRAIDAVKPYHELGQEEQMKICELRAREQQKRAAETTEAPLTVATGGDASRAQVSALLQQAWAADGSPFGGQPYDPSAVQIVPQGGSVNLGNLGADG